MQFNTVVIVNNMQAGGSRHRLRRTSNHAAAAWSIGVILQSCAVKNVMQNERNEGLQQEGRGRNNSSHAVFRVNRTKLSGVRDVPDRVARFVFPRDQKLHNTTISEFKYHLREAITYSSLRSFQGQ